MSRWLPALLGLFVAATLCGCASGRARSVRPVKPATLAELRWIGRLDREYQLVENFAESCPIAHRTGLGKPPTRRLRHYLALAAAACKAFEDGTSGSGSAQAKKSLDDSLELMGQANEILSPLRPGIRPLPRIGTSTGRSRIAVRYTRVADAIGENAHAVVRCWSLSDWSKLVTRASVYWGRKRPGDLLGFVVKPHAVNLSPSACRALDEFTYEHARPNDRSGLDAVALGLNTLAHESEHIRHPFASEAAVECYGMQSISRAAESLGAGASYGEKVARADFRDLYPEAPSGYWTAACRDGGPLDLHPARPGWP